MVLSLKDQIDNYSTFKDWYFKIIEDFNFSYEEDLDSSNYLSAIFSQRPDIWSLDKVLTQIKELIQSKSFVLIYGCGPSLEETVNSILDTKGIDFFKDCINLAADGASVLLSEKNIPINVIFTDLDGITIKEFNLSDFIVVHAHGDNKDKLQQFKTEIINCKNIIGTTPVEPDEYLLNPGGFTDGDRILYFLRSLLLPYQSVYLIGMDFKNKVGRFSKPNQTVNHEASPIKIKKLQYAVTLLEGLIKQINNDIYFVNSPESSKEFKYLSINDFFDRCQ